MIKGKLISALDFAKDKKAKHGKVSFRRDGKWFVTNFGPGYSNTFEVSRYDEAGLAWLEANEEKGG